MEAQNLYQICQKSASHDTGISFHSRNPDKPPERMSYRELLDRADQDVSRIDNIPGVRPDSVIFLHFARHHYSIRWFWAVVAAGYVPAISPPLTSDFGQRKQHLNHIFKLLRDPIVLTSNSLRPEFLCHKSLRVHTVESLQLPGLHKSYGTTSKSAHSPPGDHKKVDELAVLMLTSGSSGNPNAVCLQHGQIIHALREKVASHQTKQEDRFLNYIGLDHVANLTEIHLHAMYLGAEQMHIPGSYIVQEPLLFLRLIHEDRISYSFATRSLLASLVRSLKDNIPHKLDLSCLKALVTGGDANPIATCTLLIGMLRTYGAGGHFLRPGFGMTETCAGCTYSKVCPEYEQERSLEYASQGIPTKAIDMRVISAQVQEAPVVLTGVKGSLQVRGLAVFAKYFNNAQATQEAFTPDGWFETGDDAIIYPDGHLVICGRPNEIVTINGKEFVPLDFETAVEKAEVPGITPSYIVAFDFPPMASDTGAITVLYVPEPGYGDVQARATINQAIAAECVKLSGVVPWDILAVDKASLPKSSLGKISRVKTLEAYDKGVYFQFRGSPSV